ncbi:MAG: hypothetical protein AB8G17_03470, partial [Gammaproteobacteria bacterium]
TGDPLHPHIPTPYVLAIEFALQKFGSAATDPFTYAPAMALLGTPTLPARTEELGGYSLLKGLRGVEQALESACRLRVEKN